MHALGGFGNSSNPFFQCLRIVSGTNLGYAEGMMQASPHPPGQWRRPSFAAEITMAADPHATLGRFDVCCFLVRIFSTEDEASDVLLPI